jgi:hypothetical protein
MNTTQRFDFIRLVKAIAVLVGAAIAGPGLGATFVVTTTNDSGSGSFREAILSANLTTNVPDVIHFDIAGGGPHTIRPLTPLPLVTDPVLIDGYSQPGASPNTLAKGDNAVVRIMVLERLVLDTVQSTVRGLAIPQIQVGDKPGLNGSNVVEGCFIGLDATGTNSLGSPGAGVFVQTPNNRVGGTSPAARNVISGKGATGIEIFEIFATNNVVQGNFIGTDRTGTRAIGNTDRALAINMNASGNFIGGSVAGAGNVISGNLDRGITLDGSSNVVEGNWIGTTVTGQPLGNARTGVEIGGAANRVGGSRSGTGNIIAFNGVDTRGFFTTNGVDVKPGTTSYWLLGNSIYENAGLGIDVNANGQATPGFPVLTLASNTPNGTLIKGTFMPNVGFQLELFTSPVADPSGYGEGKTLLVATNVPTDGAGNFSVLWPVPVAPGLALSATANYATEFSQAVTVTAAGHTNSWANSAGGKWETGSHWSLNVPPYGGHSLVLITNPVTKTIQNDATTADAFPTTMTISNLVIGGPTGTTNTLMLAHDGTSTPLRVLKNFTVNSGGAVVISNAALQLEGPVGTQVLMDGEMTLNRGSLNVSNNSVQFYVGHRGSGLLTVSNGTFRAYYPIIGARDGSDGTWHIAGGTNIVTTTFDLGDSLTATGTVKMTGGLLTTPSAYIGLFGNGRMLVSDGFFSCANQGLVASQAGAQGTFTASGGVSIFGSMLIGESSTATGAVHVTDSAVVQVIGPMDNRGTVTVSGGLLVVTDLHVGGLFNPGVGRMTISDGTTLVRNVFVGGQAAGDGAITMSGGTLTSSQLVVNASSRFFFNSGLLQAQSAAVAGTVPFVVGDGIGNANLNLIGGTNAFAAGLHIAGNSRLTGAGIVTADVTNSGVIAPGDVTTGRINIRGSLVLSNRSDLRLDLAGYTPGTNFDFIGVLDNVTLGGKLSVSLADNFQAVMTNGASFTLLTADSPLTGAFTNVASGGLLTTTDGYARFTVSYTGTNILRLTNLVIVDTDGDGMPDWWEDAYSFQKLNSEDGLLDRDGDGASNRDEFLAGTSPISAASVFRIVGVQETNANVRISWTTVGGKSYRVQTNAPTANGFTNAFVDFSPVITAPGAGEATTNFLFNGRTTNSPSGYYRIRVGP